MKPNENEYVPYYQYYIDACPSNDLVTNLKQFHTETMSMLKTIPDNKGSYAYADGKWTVKEVLQHIIDTERIFNYRALCIARGETNPLPGFDHDEYTKNSIAEKRNLSDLIAEFDIIRQSSIALFNSLNESALTNMGNTNGADVSVRAIGFFMAGHTQHHLSVIKDKYLS